MISTWHPAGKTLHPSPLPSVPTAFGGCIGHHHVLSHPLVSPQSITTGHMVAKPAAMAGGRGTHRGQREAKQTRFLLAPPACVTPEGAAGGRRTYPALLQHKPSLLGCLSLNSL